MWKLKLKEEIKSSLTQEEKTTLKDLKSNGNIIITKTYTGRQVVILDKNHYIESIYKLLNDGLYVIITHDPSSQELTKIKSAIKSFLNATKSRLSSFSNCTRFYTLLKVPKPDNPFRPISNIDSASYCLPKFLTIIFSALFSTINFAKIIQNFLITILIMVSFDVKSLFKNIQ